MNRIGRTADLTDDEIAAIDAAGAKGPRSLSWWFRTDVLCISLLFFQVFCLVLLLYTCGWLHIPFLE